MKISKIDYKINSLRCSSINRNYVEQPLCTTDLSNMPHYFIPSFGAKTNTQKLEYIGADNFPNSQILQAYKTAIENGEDVLLCDIHKDFYSKLLDCSTLDEAKEFYPEFNDVIDAKNLPIEDYNATLQRVAQGSLEDVDIESLSLELLKRHYALAYGYGKKECYWNLAPSSTLNLFKKLNIKNLNREYFLTINRETPERRRVNAENAKRSWQNPEYREGRSEDARKRWKRPEYRQMRQESLEKQWADSEKREAQAEAMRKMHHQPGFEEKRIASIKKGWDDPQRRVELTQINQQNLANRWANPESRVKMSEFMINKWQDPVYREKICSGISARMIERWKDPAYIELKTSEKKEQWSNPEFREHMSKVMEEHWQNPEYRKKMAIYSEALKLAWEMHPEITEKMSEIATGFPGLGKILNNAERGTLTKQEEIILNSYYKKCHEAMPNFTWIVGQTQKEILALWTNLETPKD